MINVTDCEKCIHKEVCGYVGKLNDTSKDFKNAFRGFDVDKIFEVTFKCRKFDERKAAIRGFNGERR